MARWISLVGWMGIAGGMAVCILGFSAFLAPGFWFTDNMSFFQRQFVGAALCGLIGGLAGLTVSHRLPVLYRKSILILGVMIVTLGGLLMARIDAVTPDMPEAEGARPAKRIRLVSINLEHLDLRDEILIAYLDSLKADVIVLEETSFGWQRRHMTGSGGTSELTSFGPYPVHVAEGTLGDVVVFSRFPVTRLTPVTITGHDNGNPYDDTNREVLSLTLDLGDQPLNLIAVHPSSPRTPARWSDRQAYFEAVGTEIDRLDAQAPLIVFGDWNLSPWSGHFLRLLTDNGLTTAFPDGLPQTTRFFFDYRLHWLLGAIVDHVAVSAGIVIDNVELGPVLPTDHLPLVVDVSVAGPATVNAN